MTVILGGKTLKCTDVSEPNFDLVGTKSDTWEDGVFNRKVEVYGLVRKWSFDCTEKDVDWEDSAAKYLREQAALGTVLELDVTETVRYVVLAANVRVTGVELRLPAIGKNNIRYFTVALEEAVISSEEAPSEGDWIIIDGLETENYTATGEGGKFWFRHCKITNLTLTGLYGLKVDNSEITFLTATGEMDLYGAEIRNSASDVITVTSRMPADPYTLMNMKKAIVEDCNVSTAITITGVDCDLVSLKNVTMLQDPELSAGSITLTFWGDSPQGNVEEVVLDTITAYALVLTARTINYYTAVNLNVTSITVNAEILH